MKRLTLLGLLTGSLLQTGNLSAQILNAGFEQNVPGTTAIANWTAMLSIPIGCPNLDSVWFQTTDAHTGNYALEIRNIDCAPTAIVRPDVSATDNGPTYGPTIPFFFTPTDFSFYYKGVSTGGDGLEVSFTIIDSFFNPVGIADTILFAPVVSSYTKITIPIIYQSSQMPFKLIARIRTMNPINSINVGTWYRLDDFAYSENMTSVKDGLHPGTGIVCYPNPATDRLHIKVSYLDKVNSVCIVDAFGRIVKQMSQINNNGDLDIDVRELPAGIYFAKVKVGETSHRASFVKR